MKADLQGIKGQYRCQDTIAHVYPDTCLNLHTAYGPLVFSKVILEHRVLSKLEHRTGIGT